MTNTPSNEAINSITHPSESPDIASFNGTNNIPSFQSPYLKSRHKPWSQYYLDYPCLLKFIHSHSGTSNGQYQKNHHRIFKRSDTFSFESSRSITSLPSNHIVRLFVDELDDEVDKIALFVLKQQGIISEKFLSLLDISDKEAGSELCNAAQHLHFLLQYLHLVSPCSASLMEGEFHVFSYGCRQSLCGDV